MNIGQLRNRIELQSLVDTVDAIGQPSTAWLTTASLWADVRYVNGLSAIKADVDVSVARASIRVRYTAVSPAQRVKLGNTVFAIDAVMPDPRKTYVDLVCKVVT